MSEKQKVRILGVMFLALGVILYLIGMSKFALVMVFGGVGTFIIADKANSLADEDQYMDDDFRYGR